MSSQVTMVMRSFLSITSFVSLLHLMRTIHQNIKHSRDCSTPMLKVVFFMTISLFVFNLSLLGYYIPRLLTLNKDGNIFINSKLGEYACFIIGRINDFSFLCSVLWYADMALMLGYLLSGYSVSWIKNHLCKQHVFVWLTSLVLWLVGFVPFFLLDRNLQEYCWMENPIESYTYNLMINFTPVICTILLSIVVLLMALYQLKHRKMILDITFFVGCFVIVWSIPTIHVITVWMSHPYDFLDEIYYMILTGAGMFHYLVWFSLSSLSRTKFSPRISKTLEEEGEGKLRLWHSSYIISTLESFPFVHHSGPPVHSVYSSTISSLGDSDPDRFGQLIRSASQMSGESITEKKSII